MAATDQRQAQFRAWYSRESVQAKLRRARILRDDRREVYANVYVRKDGSLVVLTAATPESSTMGKSYSRCWPDSEDRGLVVRWVRHATETEALSGEVGS